MTNLNSPKSGLKKVAMTLAFLASLASQTFAKNNANPTITNETGNALNWNMPDGMPSNALHVDDEMRAPDGIEGGGNPTVKSKADMELQKNALEMLAKSNGDRHNTGLRDTLITQALVSAKEIIKANYTTDVTKYNELHQKQFAKMQKKKKVGFDAIDFEFEDGNIFTKLFDNDKIKFDEDDPNAKPVQAAWNDLLKEFSSGFRTIIKKIATKRDSMSMADAMQQAIDEVTEKVLGKYKKYLEELWKYNKVTYQGKAK